MNTDDISIDGKLINYNVELPIIKFIFNNPKKINEYISDYFLSIESAVCFNALKEIENFSNLTLDQFAKIVAGSNKDKLKEESLLKAFNKSDNIDTKQELIYKKKLINDYTKYKLEKKVFEKIELLVKSKGYLDKKELLEVNTQIQLIANNLEESETHRLYTTTDLYNAHSKIIEERSQGLIQRTLGYKELDNLVTRPGAAGEITSFIALTGIGKTMWLQNLRYKLAINPYSKKKICLLYLPFEMSLESDMDRYLSQKHDFSMKDLQDPAYLKQKVKNIKIALRQLTQYNNILFMNDPMTSFQDLDTKVIPKAKAHFKEQGVLPEDQYMVVMFDALTHLVDFDDQTSKDYELAMKAQSMLALRHNIHCVNVAQANENKFRYGSKFKTHSDLDNFALGLEDIFGSSAISKASRAVFTLNRPLVMKERFFPMEREEWSKEFEGDGKGDTLFAHLIKQNDGQLGTAEFTVLPNMLIIPKMVKG